ncbi:MAG: hypothetical protein Tp136SUR676911_47 [Prokaryotic dsDNA virus sp.]|jgi:hypothetical protein|nr:MAG: hypothetical protein Tp136SUR676911_47 [Prokaryotic dsDNA virus sp.]|tara:strand:- start:30093 stop:31031 length:939 start_codon:yes stop_codon:yes gene_type:complete
MATATGSGLRVGYVAESTIGTTPATPEFKVLETTGFNVNLTKELIEATLLGGRDRKCLRHGNRTVGGDIPSLLIYGHQDDLLEAALGGTWEADTPAVGTDQLTNGSVRRGFTIFRQDPALGADSYRYYTGCEMNTLNLELTPNSDVVFTVGVIGVDSPNEHAEKAGATYIEPSGDCPFSYDSGSILDDGVELADVTQLTMTVENNIESSFVLFSKTTGSKPQGKINVSGNVTAQFQNFTLYDKFISGEKSSLEVNLLDEAGNAYKITLPRTMFNTGNTDVGGEGEITISLDFTAELDSATGSTIIVERTPVV